MSRRRPSPVLIVGFSHYLLAATALFAIGLFGLLTRRNAIRMLLAIELMLTAANLAFAACSSFLGNLTGQIFVLFVVVVAAAEVTVGLSIVVAIHRSHQHLDVDRLNLLRR